jgi:hypothetical protein
MRFVRSAALALVLTTGLAAPALADAPAEFTSIGVAHSFQDGQTAEIPNTLHYSHGRVRLEMKPPAVASDQTVFPIVLAHDGGDVITVLNPGEKQAMAINASTIEQVTSNPALQKISNFKLNDVGKTFRSASKKVGAEAIAGQPCTVFDQQSAGGRFRMWLSDKFDIPLKFAYFEGAKGSEKLAFDYEVLRFQPKSAVADSAYEVPGNYTLIDLSEMTRGGGAFSAPIMTPFQTPTMSARGPRRPWGRSRGPGAPAWRASRPPEGCPRARRRR